eukprot:TRINITY_DN57460_c0_g1_i1.p1 TRINITY_DN57460_c0_g1~~TRINITY_DN57460_c0_g1_i1.p1  ORF type:complete len:266 (-),score=31.86 TRINITY_DN57460_c0_g1_i1:100-897(-)
MQQRVTHHWPAAATGFVALTLVGLASSSQRPTWGTVFLQPGVRSATLSTHNGAAVSLATSANPKRPVSASSSVNIGLLGLCAAIAARSVVSKVTRWSGTKARRTPNRPTDWNDVTLGYRIRGPPGFPGSPHGWCEPIRWCSRFKTRIKLRKKYEGTSVRPRVAIHRAENHMNLNVVDDTIGLGKTLLTITTKQKLLTEQIREKQGCDAGYEKTWSVEAAEIVGAELAKQCLEKNITQIVFDRGGWPYEGRVKALAEAARSAGLQF